MTQILRIPQIDLKSVLEDPNPHIDLKIQAFEESTSSFLKAVSNYKNRSIQQITERRAKGAAEKKKIAEKCQAIEAETNQCKVKEIELMSILEKEQNERKEAELSVSSLKRQLSALDEKCAALEDEIKEYRAITDSLKRERYNERTTLKRHASNLTPEVEVLETALGCVIEGLENNQLLVRFTRVDESDLNREFSFILDVSTRSYKVLKTSPPLPTLPALLDNLNLTGDINRFIVDIRQAFYKMVNV
ncbi:kinetochore-associated Ndc80 complex subunit spc25 [Stygiomarasmius scandens]|uniref:Kinetochore protein SPC25 n=1 Tax=Marasmiellus scandens TaxID=2682957 RepID=A0ABR1K459_9AGAR